MQIETMSRNRTRYSFERKNIKGERIVVELTRINCSDHNFMELWVKHGYMKRMLPDYWNIDVYVHDREGYCWGRYNPQIRKDTRKINFDWILEATEENKEKILEEVKRRAYSVGGTRGEGKPLNRM